MKKILISLFTLVLVCSCFNSAKAVTYKEALKSNKPIAIFVYADWADNLQNMQKSFEMMNQKYGDKFNFVNLNIASDEAKEYNKRYYIYPNLPYVILHRDGGKVSRFLKQDCVISKSCFDEKLKFFIN